VELTRAELLARAGVVAGAAALGAVPRAAAGRLDTWSDVRASFDLDGGFHNLAGFLLAPHPRPVREAIERHRRGLDRNPSEYLHAHQDALERSVRAAAAAHLGGTPAQIALTDSTTMGLGLLYGGLRLRPGDEVLTTTHDFFATHEALRLAGLRVRRVTLYDDPSGANAAEIVRRLRAAMTRRTRVVAVTWVHSSTGVKLPVRELGRAVGSRALLCVDGVHALGVEEARPGAFGIDFLVAGCHKWLAGPRGTGIVWGRDWSRIGPTIPSFDERPSSTSTAAGNTPGGFHSFEHRWALAEAFAFQRRIGQGRVRARIHELATQLKDGLAGIANVRLVTPRSPAVSAGIVCCEIHGLTADEAVARLRDRHRVLATVTPYATRYLRFGPGLYSSEEDVEAAIRAVRALAS
jgi:selenocysteine lyase/cysteine desulfurase